MRLHARFAHLKAYLCRCCPQERVNKCFDVSKWWNCVRNRRRVYINNKNVYRAGMELSGRDNEWKNPTITTKTWKRKVIRGWIGASVPRARCIVAWYFSSTLSNCWWNLLPTLSVQILFTRIYVHFYQPLNALVIYIESQEIYDRFRNHP